MKIGRFTKSYAGRRVLEMPELVLEKGVIYGVIGANGSGKSTLAKVLAGVEPPDGAWLAPAGIRVGYLPQKSYAFRMSVLANVCLAGGDRAAAMERLEALGIEHLARRRADRLSGGETARMAAARVMMRPCDLLILDEPTASMDMQSTALTERLIQDFRRETGCAVLLITHSLGQAGRLADRILFLSRGRLAEEGEREQVLRRPKHPDTREFLDFCGV